MSIKTNKSTMVYPASNTPRVSLWLSRIDMIVRQPYSHTHLLYIYHHPTNDGSSTNFFDTNIMKESLSRVLVPFYPVAGRLKFNGRYEIECNAKGALFIEAEAPTYGLADFGDSHLLRNMVFPTVDYSGGLSSFPLLLVQLTRFKCGGVCLGVLVHHHVADGTSHLYFIKSWARLAKGLDLGVYPIHDRATYLGPRQPPQVKFQHKEYDHPSLFRKDFPDHMMMTTECVFKLTKEQVNVLKLQAINSEMPSHKVSTFAVLVGHVWRTACKARGLVGDQEVRLYMPVDGRTRLKGPKLPQGYFGNVIFVSICVEKAGDVMCKPLWYVANKIQQTINRMEDEEYLRSTIDYLESCPDLDSLVRGHDLFASPNLGVNSWSRIPFKEVDFGWGGAEITSVHGIKFEGQIYLIPSPNGDGGLFVATKLLATHMTFFKKHLYEIKSSSIASI